MIWFVVAVVFGLLIAIGKSGLGQNGKPVVTVESGNMAARSEITKWTSRGYVLTSDSVHTFGKHTLVFTKQSLAGSPPAAQSSGTASEISWLEGGQRYLLGYTLDSPYYGIWDRTRPGPPVAKFPYNEHGKGEALGRMQQLEKEALSLAPSETPPAPEVTPLSADPSALPMATTSSGPTASEVAHGAWASQSASQSQATTGRVTSPFTSKPVNPQARTRGLIALAIIAVVAFTYSWVASKPNIGHSSSPPAATSGGVDQGFGTQDATADVTLNNASCHVSYGVLTCALDIVNHSGGTSDYYVEAEIDDASGANIGYGNALVSHVAAGQTAHAELTGTFTGELDTVHVTQVQRTAS